MRDYQVKARDYQVKIFASFIIIPIKIKVGVVGKGSDQ